jgi:hypothetical protein
MAPAAISDNFWGLPMRVVVGSDHRGAQTVASLVLLAAVCGGTDSWIGGFAAAVQSPLERCFHDIRP